jgi:uncharacterized protein YbbC (DUF1343 family)
MAPVTAVPRMVRFGVDGLLADRARCGAARRIGMVTNDAACPAGDPSLASRVALRAAGVPLVRLFGPEHGLQRTAADGAAVEDGRDALTGLPVVSLYGARMRPTAAQLADLDLVLFDVPDVGARFYTYTGHCITCWPRARRRVCRYWCWTVRTRWGACWRPLRDR